MTDLSGMAVNAALTAAQKLAELMATEAWPALKQKLAKLLGRGDAAAETAAAAGLDAAGQVPDAASFLHGQLFAFLQADPAHLDQLKGLLAEFEGEDGGAPAVRQHQEVKGSHNVAIQAGRDVKYDKH